MGGGDSPEYATLVQNLLTEHRFTMNTQAPFIPETFRTPGYPLFMVIAMLIYKSYFTVTFLQIIIVWLSSVIIFEIGKRLFNPIVGFIAALCFMLDPTVILYTMVILTDIPFVLLILLTIYTLFFQGDSFDKSHIKDRSLYGRALFAGVILGVAVLFRPVAMYLPPILIFFYWFHLRHGQEVSNRVHWRRFLLASVCLIIGTTVVVFPWVARNKIEVGIWGISSITAYNLHDFNIPGFLEWKGMSSSQAEGFMTKKTGVDEVGAFLLSNSSRITKVAEGVILSNPIDYLEYHFAESTPFITSSGLSIIDKFNTYGFEKTLYSGTIPPGLFLAESVVWVCILAFACLAWFVFRRDYRVSLCMALTLYFWAITGPVAFARYRLPAEPFLLLLGVGGVGWLYSKYKNRKRSKTV